MTTALAPLPPLEQMPDAARASIRVTTLIAMVLNPNLSPMVREVAEHRLTRFHAFRDKGKTVAEAMEAAYDDTVPMVCAWHEQADKPGLSHGICAQCAAKYFPEQESAA